MKHLLIVFVAALTLTGSQAQTPDPLTFTLTTTPPITLEYVGAFRLPRDMYPAETNPTAWPPEFVSLDAYDDGALVGFDGATNSLIVGTRRNRVALVSIPTPSQAEVVTDLPFATLRSGFIDPSGNTWEGIADTFGYAGLYGGLVLGDKFFYTGANFYDANNNTRHAFRVAKFPLTTPAVEVTPWRTVGGYLDQGHIAGYFIPIPARHQAALGGSVCTGLQAVSIQFRTSAGPVCHAWKPEALLTGDAPATMLVGYPSGHWTLGPWEGVNPFYGITTQIYGGNFVGDWLMFWGSHGIGTPAYKSCYGNGTGDITRVGTVGPDGEPWCYDPTNSSKAQHGYPYQFQQYAYKVSELADVAAGKRDPWSLTPIVWKVDQPFAKDLIQKKLGGVVEGNGYIYVSQLYADIDGYNWRSLILVYKATQVGDTPPPPPPPIDPVIAELQARIVGLSSQVATLEARVRDVSSERDAVTAAKSAETARIVVIKALIQQALDASKPNTANAIKNPLKIAMTK